MKVLLPTTTPLDPALPEGALAVPYDPTSPVPAEHRDAEVLVVWLATPEWAAQTARDLPRLRLVQSLAAGTDALAGAAFAPATRICSGVGLHDITVSEHAMALVLAAARRLDIALRATHAHRWANELAEDQPLDNLTELGLIHGSHVVIWGYGSIGTRLGRLLRAFGARVTGIARTAGERDGVRVVTDSSLAEVLPEADVLVSLLPSTPATATIVTADVLALLPRHAWFVNVGRGATVDQMALVRALHDGVVAGAALDVTTPEPLPPDDPLWDAPNLILTPHSAGGRPLGADERIAENVRRLAGGEDLLHEVPRE